ncbi:MAG: Type 1 glutamine amidotransferase-like domain-containing protein [Deltaproteobacteria bacterium]|nr:Type 1 glutamine amidotransferase-like domain-containing protein [Deltaproteobacteria bacterium]
MADRRPMYLFASGRGAQARATLERLGPVLAQLNKERPTIAYIGVASFRDNWLVYLLVTGLLRMKVRCRITRVVIAPKNADLELAREQCLAADAIFFSGGDVDAGAQILRDKGMDAFFQDLAQTSKLFFGISAGSIILGREWVRWTAPADESSATIFPCLGIAPVICDVHDEEDDWPELRALLRLEREGTVGYGITSGSCLKVSPDGGLSAEHGTVVRLALRDGVVERLPDLLAEDSRAVAKVDQAQIVSKN